MNYYTQPVTEEERRRVDEFRNQGMASFLDQWFPPEPTGDGHDAPGFDYFALNRELSS